MPTSQTASKNEQVGSLDRRDGSRVTLGVWSRQIVSAIIYVIKHGLTWCDATKDYEPHKTIYNRFIRWSRLGVFNRIFAELAGKAAEPGGLEIKSGLLRVS